MVDAPYVELHAHSAFSFLDGASTPTELAGAADELGYPAFALTDHDGVWGSMEFAHACKGLGVRPIAGAELTITTCPPAEELAHVTLLVEDSVGWRNLCRLLTAAHSHTRDNTGRTAEQPWATPEQLEAHAEWPPLPLRLRRLGRPRRRLGARRTGPRRGARPPPARRLRPRPLPGRAAAPLVAPRPRPQPLARRSRRAARRSQRGDRRRPLPRPPPRPSPGRLRRGAPRDHPRGLRAAPPRQLQLGARLAARDGGPLRRAPGGGGGDPAPRRAPPLRPHRRAGLPLPRLREPRRRPRAGRGLPGPPRRALRRLAPPRRRRAPPRAGAGDDPQARPLRLLPPAPRPARAGPRGGARGARPRLGPCRAPPRPGARLQRQLDRLLPDRPLPRRPGRGGAVRGPLPQRRSHGDARHRPRLSRATSARG